MRTVRFLEERVAEAVAKALNGMGISALWSDCNPLNVITSATKAQIKAIIEVVSV